MDGREEIGSLLDNQPWGPRVIVPTTWGWSRLGRGWRDQNTGDDPGTDISPLQGGEDRPRGRPVQGERVFPSVSRDSSTSDAWWPPLVAGKARRGVGREGKGVIRHAVLSCEKLRKPAD